MSTRNESMIGVNLDDLTGKRFGRYVVLYRAESKMLPSGRKTTMWHCKCDCGTERDVAAQSLKNGDSKSCGCLKVDNLRVIRDLTGQKINRWTVLGPGEDYVSPKGRHLRTWHCKCDCGTERDVAENALVHGKTISCGCYRIEHLRESVTYEDLTGRQFGHWTVLERDADRFYSNCGGRSQMWKCRCDCGNIRSIDKNMLKLGISQSCGCGRSTKSIVEDHVTVYLDENHFQYVRNKTYDGLVGVGGRLLSYDFLVISTDGASDYLIECQGEQHYKPVKFFGGDVQFDIQQKHDALKKLFAAEHGIPLVEIPYTVRSKDAVSAFMDLLRDE